jgi:D-cysteine desulfhydrase
MAAPHTSNNVFPPSPPRVRLAHLPTPVHPLARLSAELGIAIDIKRDDLTGCALSGNKIRKLEFVLADARHRGATCVVTCGGVQSNHCRATAGAAAQLGLRCVLLLRGSAPGLPDGNLFLDRLLGAEIRWVSAAEYEHRDEHMAAVAEVLRARGEKPYVLPEGASNALGAWGYVQMMRELREQAGEFPWRMIVSAIGSGGTHAGLLLGSRLLGLDVRVRSYSVQRSPEYFRDQVLTIAGAFDRDFGTRVALQGCDVEVIDGFEGPAYAEVYPEEVATIRDIAQREGVILDPVYTGKAFTGLLSDVRAGRIPCRERVLFIHTGGIFGLMAQRREFY